MICNCLNAIMLYNMITLLKTMKTKLYIYSQLNYLTSRTAIEAEILFAVCVIEKQALTGGKSLACEDKCSKKIGAVLVQQADRRSFEAIAVPILVYFYLLCNNKSYKESSGFLRAEPLSSSFEDRRGCRGGKKLLSNKSVFPPLTYHLQSAQFITNAKGEQYEHIEYTPYGELWIEETAPGIDKLPFRFTGKELDEETGLYYYGARYLDPKYSRWLSGDPALNDYIPQAPVNDEAKKHNENLPGMGGVFNTVNLHVYHYAGNNPVKYTDPDGKFILMFGLSSTAGAGTGVSNNTGIFICISNDFKKISIGQYTTSQTGAYIGLGASIGWEFTIAPFAQDFSDIEGFALVAGGSAVGIGGEVGYNPSAKTFSEKIRSITIAGSNSIGPGFPGEGHVWTAYTKKIVEFSLDKPIYEIIQIKKYIESFIKDNDIDGLNDYLRKKDFFNDIFGGE